MNIEEKVKELYPDAWDDDLYPVKLQWRVDDERRAYKDGYTQAETDLNIENEKLRDALREVTNYFSDRMKKEGGLYSYELDIYRKSKQLTTEEK